MAVRPPTMKLCVRHLLSCCLLLHRLTHHHNHHRSQGKRGRKVRSDKSRNNWNVIGRCSYSMSIEMCYRGEGRESLQVILSGKKNKLSGDVALWCHPSSDVNYQLTCKEEWIIQNRRGQLVLLFMYRWHSSRLFSNMLMCIMRENCADLDRTGSSTLNFLT